MKITDDEKELLELTRKLESGRCKSDLRSYAEAMVRAQEALKVDYGLLPESIPTQTAGGKPAAVGV